MANQAEAAPVRGLLLIGVALLIGALFLSKGFDTPDIDFGDDLSADDEVPEAGTGTDSSPSTLPAAGDARDPAEVPVYVANGSGVGGAAGVMTEQLRAAGYTSAIEPQGSAPQTQATQVFYFDDTWRADAEAVASVIGAQPTQVLPLPTPPPFEVLGNATVVVYLAADLAQPQG